MSTKFLLVPRIQVKIANETDPYPEKMVSDNEVDQAQDQNVRVIRRKLVGLGLMLATEGDFNLLVGLGLMIATENGDLIFSPALARSLNAQTELHQTLFPVHPIPPQWPATGYSRADILNLSEDAVRPLCQAYDKTFPQDASVEVMRETLLDCLGASTSMHDTD